jgi:hypothetical protein
MIYHADLVPDMVTDPAPDMVPHPIPDLFPGDRAPKNDAVRNTDFNKSSDSELRVAYCNIKKSSVVINNLNFQTSVITY